MDANSDGLDVKHQLARRPTTKLLARALVVPPSASCAANVKSTHISADALEPAAAPPLSSLRVTPYSAPGARSTTRPPPAAPKSSARLTLGSAG